jgi:ABC-type methionine transport system ATPase subunit
VAGAKTRTVKRVRLTFPKRIIDEPIVGLLKERFGVVPNIVRGRITATSAWLEVKIAGPAGAVRRALAYLKTRGVSVHSL